MTVRLAHRTEMFFLRLLVATLAKLPLNTVRKLGDALGRLAYRPLGIRRRVVERQIQAAFPGLESNGVHRIARAAYAHFGRVVVEMAYIGGRPPNDVLAMFEGADDLTIFENARREGVGVIVVTGHLGGWELSAAYVAALGFKVSAVVRHMQNPLFDAYLNRTREQLGVRVMYDDQAVRQVPRALREGRIVAFVSDQGVKGLASSFVPFFGRPAKTPRGAAVFAQRSEAPTVFAAAMRQPSGKYWLHMREIPISRDGNRDDVVDETVAIYTRFLEALVRRYPEQYFWLHRRWRRQPPDTPAELRDPAATPAFGEMV